MPGRKNKTDKNKPSAKTALGKPRKKQRAVKNKQPDEAAAPIPDGPEQNNQRDPKKRVVAMREKLKKSLEDPEMRDQILRAVRTMLNEGR